MKTYTVTTGIIGLEKITVTQGDTVKASDFSSDEQIAWHLENGSISESGEAEDAVDHSVDSSVSEWAKFTSDQLKAKATELGLTFDSKANKATLVGLIEAKLAEPA